MIGVHIRGNLDTESHIGRLPRGHENGHLLAKASLKLSPSEGPTLTALCSRVLASTTETLHFYSLIHLVSGTDTLAHSVSDLGCHWMPDPTMWAGFCLLVPGYALLLTNPTLLCASLLTARRSWGSVPILLHMAMPLPPPRTTCLTCPGLGTSPFGLYLASGHSLAPAALCFFTASPVSPHSQA